MTRRPTLAVAVCATWVAACAGAACWLLGRPWDRWGRLTEDDVLADPDRYGWVYDPREDP